MSKKAFITGITGQDGSYLAELLLHLGYEVHGLIRRSSSFNTARIDHLIEGDSFGSRFFLHHGDVTDASRLSLLVNQIRPVEFYNLAAQSHVRVSFDTPEMTGQMTGMSTTHVLEAVYSTSPDTRVYQASSSEMFGASPPPQGLGTVFHPRSPYAAAKVYGYWMARNYREAGKLYCVNGILFNHESPRRGETFLTRKVSKAVARISLGRQERVVLGNLKAYRDWGYAPEYVISMWKMLQNGTPRDWVVGTGESTQVDSFVNHAFVYAGLSPDEYVVTDPQYFRATEVDHLRADVSETASSLGWKSATDVQELAEIMVNHDLEQQENPSAVDQIDWDELIRQCI